MGPRVLPAAALRRHVGCRRDDRRSTRMLRRGRARTRGHRHARGMVRVGLVDRRPGIACASLRCRDGETSWSRRVTTTAAGTSIEPTHSCDVNCPSAYAAPIIETGSQRNIPRNAHCGSRTPSSASGAGGGTATGGKRRGHGSASASRRAVKAPQRLQNPHRSCGLPRKLRLVAHKTRPSTRSRWWRHINCATGPPNE